MFVRKRFVCGRPNALFAIKFIRAVLKKYNGRGLMKLLFLFIAILGLVAGVQMTNAQAPVADPGITATRVIGEVKTIDAPAKQLTVKTDAGSEVMVVLSDATTYSRLPPGETTLDKAVTIALTDLGEGDRVL